MLDTMRKISGGIVAKLLMLLLVISFGAWGVGDIVNSGGAGHVAKVGKKTIGAREFAQEVDRVTRQLQAQGVTADEQRVQMLVLQQLIQRKLLSNAVSESGLSVDDATTARAIANDPQFKNLDGKFSDSAFRNYLKEDGKSETAFLQHMKLQLSGMFFMDSMSLRDITPPAAVLSLAARAAGETRDVVLITIPTKTTTPSDADIEGYYNEYKSSQFLAPERRTLEYVGINQTEVQALIDASITPEMRAARAKTDSKLSPNTILTQLRSEQRDSVMRQLSNSIEDALAGGATMREAVAKAGLKAEPKTLSNIVAAEYADTADKLIKTATVQGFQLGSGETSSLLTTADGRYALVTVKEVIPAAPKPLAEVKAEVTKLVAAEAAHDKALALVGDVKTALGKEPSWQAAIGSFNLPTRVLGRIARPVQGKAESGPLHAPLATAVFEQEVGKTAGPFTTPSGDIQLAHVLASHAATEASPTAMATALNELNTSLSQDVQSAALSAMAAQQGVTINEAAFRNKAQAE